VTAAAGRRGAPPEPTGGDLAPETVVAGIAAAEGRQRLRFRLLFAATWLVLVGGLVFALLSSHAYDTDFVAAWAPFILGGVPLTILVSVCAIALAMPFALLGALGRISRSPVVYAVASLYVSLVRGTPLIVQILFVYLALPQIVPAAAGVPLVALGIFALAFNYGAYTTEIFRAGIEAVPRGQREAATALGLTERRIMRRIVLPQAVRIVTPAIGNEFIAMTKDSALVYVMGVQELLWRATHVGQSRFKSLETLVLAAAVYWVLTIVLSFFQERLERRMARSGH
jgi:polar amino acid transport system permease protein